ncbi:2-hydroxyacid dehydrogenase [Ruegeria profundi]|nr:2-hydroxyacid dehydrogenase [Ruegeria profundi]
MLRSPLQPPQITDEIRARFDTRDEAEALAMPEKITAVATKGDIGLPGEVMAQFPSLRMIAVYGVGVDKIDLAQARDRGIAITTTPGVLTDAVAEQAIALILAATRRIAEGDRHVRTGAWAKGKLGLGYSIRGRTLGVLGYGRIGRRIAELARAIGMDILYTDLQAVEGEEDAFRSSPAALAQDSDILVIAAAGGSGTDGLVDQKVLAALGPNGLLVNVARGSVVNEEDLIAALNTGGIAGAALDVFQNEPNPRPDLLKMPNVVLTPHLASATIDARLAMGRLVIDNLAAFFHDRPLVTPLEVLS